MERIFETQKLDQNISAAYISIHISRNEQVIINTNEFYSLKLSFCSLA